MSSFSQRIVEFTGNLSYNSLPSKVLEKAKLCTLDFLGVALAGYDAKWCEIVLNVIKKIGGNPESTILNWGFKVPAPNAALVNGTLGHSWDFDDTHVSQIHPGVVILPAALAMSEREKSSGKDFLVAVIIGYELMTRIAFAVNSPPKRGHSLKGFHPTATCGTFAAAATAGKILNLGLDKLIYALGIAGSFAAGLLEFLADGAMTKRLHPGKAAHDGIISALLAKEGFTGPKRVFEGRDGFLRAYSSDPKPEELIRGLGEEFEILNVEFKPYSSCRSTHAPLDALRNIIQIYNLSPEEVEEIIVEVSTLDWYIAGTPIRLKRNPKTPLEAQMSIPFCLSLMLLERKVIPSQFTLGKIRDIHLLSIAKKVKVKARRDFDQKQSEGAMPAVVTVKTKDKREYSSEVEHPQGSTRNPMTKKDIEEKFVQLASPVVPNATSIIRIINKLENIDDMRVLMNNLVKTVS